MEPKPILVTKADLEKITDFGLNCDKCNNPMGVRSSDRERKPDGSAPHLDRVWVRCGEHGSEKHPTGFQLRSGRAKKH